jgi:uncharacterized surface anchored protein
MFRFSTTKLYGAILVILLSTASALAQFGASVQGTTQDRASALLPNARVTLINKDTGVSQSTTSNASGEFRINSLGAGNYDITASAAGFADTTVNFVLQTNEQRNVPLMSPSARSLLYWIRPTAGPTRPLTQKL